MNVAAPGGAFANGGLFEAVIDGRGDAPAGKAKKAAEIVVFQAEGQVVVAIFLAAVEQAVPQAQ